MLYEFLAYKQYIKETSVRKKISLKELCQCAKIQGSFLTRVLKHDAQLNDQQLYCIAIELGANEEEVEYLQLLLRHEKAYNQGYKRALKKQIEGIREKKLRLGERMDSRRISDLTSRTLAEKGSPCER